MALLKYYNNFSKCLKSRNFFSYHRLGYFSWLDTCTCSVIGSAEPAIRTIVSGVAIHALMADIVRAVHAEHAMDHAKLVMGQVPTDVLRAHQRDFWTGQAAHCVMRHARRVMGRLPLIVCRAQQGAFWTGQAAHNVMRHALRVMGGLPLIVCRAKQGGF